MKRRLGSDKPKLSAVRREIELAVLQAEPADPKQTPSVILKQSGGKTTSSEKMWGNITKPLKKTLPNNNYTEIYKYAT